MGDEVEKTAETTGADIEAQLKTLNDTNKQLLQTIEQMKAQYEQAFNTSPQTENSTDDFDEYCQKVIGGKK